MMMMDEEHDELRFVCKLCDKKYPSGKSVGGHMMSHVLAAVNSYESDEKFSSLMMNGSGSGSVNGIESSSSSRSEAFASVSARSNTTPKLKTVQLIRLLHTMFVSIKGGYGGGGRSDGGGGRSGGGGGLKERDT